MNYGLNDEVSNVWANEQCYASALKVFTALDQPGRLGVMCLPGFHGANDIEGNLDWLDIQFGRTQRTWRNDLLFPWDFAEWRKTTGDKIDLTKASARAANGTLSPAVTRAAVEWLLGPTPAKYVAPAFGRGGFPGRGSTATAMKPVANPGQLGPDVAAWVIARNSASFGWNDPARSAADTRRIRFGGGITGDLYFPAGTPVEKKLPAVIWLDRQRSADFSPLHRRIADALAFFESLPILIR